MTDIYKDFHDLLKRTVAVCDSDDLYLDLNKETGVLDISVDASDIFGWGHSDWENITPDNIELLEKCHADLWPVIGLRSLVYVGILFCCRLHNRQPQELWYEKLPFACHHLFRELPVNSSSSVYEEA